MTQAKEHTLIWKTKYSILLCFSLVVSADATNNVRTSCTDGFGLNYTLPMFRECMEKEHSNGSMVQTIPKLITLSSAEASCPRRTSKLGIPPGYRVCRFPDCDKRPCENGWCEETMEGYECHCSPGFRGIRCDKQSSTVSVTMAIPRTQPTTIASEVTTSEPSAMIFVTDTKAESIFIADLQDELVFRPIPSTPRPRDITYDHVTKKIYWTDWRYKQVWRADVNGSNMEAVTAAEKEFQPGMYGLAISNTSRTVYISYMLINKITSVPIRVGSRLPVLESDFVTEGINWPRALVVDDEQGYLYWSMAYTIARKLVNGSGGLEVIYNNMNLKNLTGLTIDLTRKYVNY